MADFSTLVDDIAHEVRKRLEALRPPGAGTDPAAPPETAAPIPVVTRALGPVPAERIRTAADLAQFIDHTLLRADATAADVKAVCAEAVTHGFATVCVNAAWVAVAADALAGSAVAPIAVVGFPLGATLSAAKAFEAKAAVLAGAREIDMVLNLGALKARDYQVVLKDVELVVEASRPAPVKVILETSQLTHEEKLIACALAKAGGAMFVKTSTGFSSGGATAEDVALMRRVVGDSMGVKASGGVRTTDDAMRMLAAGANRIGASSSVAIITGGKSDSTY